MPQRIKVGVIGLGWPGREHLKGYKTLVDVDVVALCDKDKKLLREQAEEHNVPETYTGHREMLKESDLDAVSVCLPNFLHCPVTVDVLKAGKHVLCEKPPAMNAKEAKLMAQAAKGATKGGHGKVLMYALVQRFSDGAKVVKKYVENGDLGDIYFAKAAYVRRRGIPLGGRAWFIDKDRSGGGALIDIGVHALDCVWWLMGNPEPVSVFGAAYSKFGNTAPKGAKYNVDDSAFAMIKFKNAASLILETSWALNLKEGSNCQIAGTKGGAQLNPLTIFTESNVRGNGVQIDVTPKPPQTNPFAGETEHFIKCVREGKEPIPSAEHGITLMKMLDAVYESGRTGKAVRIR